MTDSRRRYRALTLSAVIYTIAYLTRSNLSIAAPLLIAKGSMNAVQIGFLGTLFFWVYAIGQLLVSLCLKRLGPRGFIFSGLIGSAACNMLFAWGQSYPIALIAWSLNALSLSFMWPPLLSYLSDYFGQRDHSLVAIIMNLPCSLALVIQWGIMARQLSGLDVKWSFIVPALIALAGSVLWLALSTSRHPRDQGLTSKDLTADSCKRQSSNTERQTILSALLSPYLLSLAICLLLIGALRESMNLWLPSLLEAYSSAELQLNHLSPLLPLLTSLGLIFNGLYLSKKPEALPKLVKISLCVNVLAATPFLLNRSSVVLLSGLSILQITTYALTAMLTTLLPLKLHAEGFSKTSLGFFNFLSYLGASAGGLISGIVVKNGSNSAQLGLWFALSLLALLTYIAIQRKAATS